MKGGRKAQTHNLSAGMTAHTTPCDLQFWLPSERLSWLHVHWIIDLSPDACFTDASIHKHIYDQGSVICLYWKLVTLWTMQHALVGLKSEGGQKRLTMHLSWVVPVPGTERSGFVFAYNRSLSREFAGSYTPIFVSLFFARRTEHAAVFDNNLLKRLDGQLR